MFNSFSSYTSQVWMYVDSLIYGAIAAVMAFSLSRRWLVALLVGLTIALAVLFLWFLPSRLPQEDFLSSDVPFLFYGFYWPVLLVFCVALMFGTANLVRTARASGVEGSEAGAAEALAGADPDLESAWSEISARLREAHVDLAEQSAYLVLAPEAGWSEALLGASGASVLASGPDAPGPVHAFATSDGVMFDLAGVSCLAAQSVGSIPRLEAFCRLILARRPDCPVVRGVFIIFPAAWLLRDDTLKAAGAVRDDLRVLERVLQVRCPVSVLVTGMESQPGFREFLERIPTELIARRCGYSVSPPEPFSRELVQKMLNWMTRWFYDYNIDAMVDKVTEQAGNNRLFSFDYAFRKLRPKLRAALEAAFSDRRGDDPVLFQGCYFVGTGGLPREQAFAAGLIKDRKDGLMSSLRSARWTDDARHGDGYYRRWAVAVGLTGAGLAALVWVYLLRDSGANAWWGVVPFLLGCLWAYALAKFSRW